MNQITSIASMGRAIFRAYSGPDGNELALDGKPNTNDPVKIRGGTYDRGNYYLGLSGDLLDGNMDDPVRHSKVEVAFKPDMDSAGSQSAQAPGGAFEVRNQKPDTTDDADMILGFRVTCDVIEFFGTPIARRNPDGSLQWLMAGGGSPAPAPVPQPDAPPELLPGDAFAQQVRAWYRDILQRQGFPYASDAEVESHRSWAHNLEGLHQMLLKLGPGN